MNKTPVEKHFDNIADKYNFYKTKNKFYYDNLKKLVSEFIPKGSRVLEIGCGTGDLIKYVSPRKGWGMDISSEMIKIAKKDVRKNGKITFSTSWPKDLYDYVFMCDVIEHLENPDLTINKISAHMNKNSVFFLTMANPLWEPILILAERFGFKMPEGPHFRLSFTTLKRKMTKAGLKIIRHDYRLLFPVEIPFVTKFINGVFEPHLRRFAFIEYIEAIKS